MKQTDPQMKLRFPPDLKARIEEVAAANGRSMNAEIVQRLADSFAPSEDALTAARAIVAHANWLSVLVHEMLEREAALQRRVKELSPVAPPPAPPAPKRRRAKP